MRVTEVLTKDITTDDKDLIIERMTQERMLAASTLAVMEMHMAAILANLFPLQHKRQEDPELNEAITEIEGSISDAMKALQFDELELDGAMDAEHTKDFIAQSAGKVQQVFERYNSKP